MAERVGLLAAAVIGALLVFPSPGPAEEQPGTAAAAGGEPAPASRLLEEIPNYAEVLVHQWTPGIGALGRRHERDVTAFGRLLETQPPQRLTLSDAILLALRHNTQLRVDRLDPLSSRAGVLSAEAVFDPSLRSDISLERERRPSAIIFTGETAEEQHTFAATTTLGKTLRSGTRLNLSWVSSRFRTNSGVVQLDPQYSTDLVFSVAQPLLRDFGLRYATILVRAARADELRAIHEYEAKVTALVQRVEEAYWRLIAAERNVDVQERAVEAAQELLRQNRSKFEVGSLPKTAVLEAEAEVAAREVDLIRARNAEKVARDELRAIINAPAAPESGTAGPLLSVEPVEPPEPEEIEIDLDKSLRRALEKRPELAAARMAVRAAALALKAAENQLLPRLDARASIGTNGLAGRNTVPSFLRGQDGSLPPNPFAGPYGDALDLLADGRFYSYSLGVTLEIPLGNTRARADYASARIDLERAHLSLRKLQEDITLQVKAAVTTVESARSALDAARVARRLAEENLRNQKARYDVGLATTKDIVDFQQRLTAARASEVQSLADYNISLARLRAAEGTLLEYRNVVLDVLPEEKTPWWLRF